MAEVENLYVNLCGYFELYFIMTDVDKFRCLLYLTVFPESHVISTSTSTTATNEIRSLLDEAKHYLDVLFIRGFVSPLEISAEGKIKSCTYIMKSKSSAPGLLRM
jgi:hypothetical protein